VSVIFIFHITGIPSFTPVLGRYLCSQNRELHFISKSSKNSDEQVRRDMLKVSIEDRGDTSTGRFSPFSDLCGETGGGETGGETGGPLQMVSQIGRDCERLEAPSKWPTKWPTNGQPDGEPGRGKKDYALERDKNSRNSGPRLGERETSGSFVGIRGAASPGNERNKVTAS
jgi:hypothetical protein